jgi:hypothetical protein
MLYSFCKTRLSVRGTMLPWQVVDAQEPGPVYFPTASSGFAAASENVEPLCADTLNGTSAKMMNIARRSELFRVRECAASSLVVIFRLAGDTRRGISEKIKKPTFYTIGFDRSQRHQLAMV